MFGQRCRHPTRFVSLLQYTTCLLLAASFFVLPTEPKIFCGGSTVKKTVTIGESTNISVVFNSSDYVNCEVTLTREDSRQILILREGTHINEWPLFCHAMKLEVFAGDSRLPLDSCNHSRFGFVRGMAGKDMRIVTVGALDLYDSHGQLEFGFVVEPINDPDDGKLYNAFVPSVPSYTWIPVAKEYRYEIESSESSCIRFEIMSERFDQHISPLDVAVSIYRGSNVEKDYDLTKDCLGESRSGLFINSFGTRVTTVVTKVNYGRGYWLVFRNDNAEGCKVVPSTSLTIESAGKEYNLFSRPGIIKGNMMCKFKLKPMPRYHQTIKFKGSLRKPYVAELYVKEEKLMNQSTLVDFGNTTSNNCFSSDDNLYIYFNTGSLINDRMASFTYGSKCKSDGGESSSKTGSIIGACLAAIVCIFIITFVVVWFVYKKRRRLREATMLSLQFNSSSPESSVSMINSVSLNNGSMLPPSYPSLSNEAFSEKPPPSYDDSVNQGMTVTPGTLATEPHPPSYSASISADGQKGMTVTPAAATPAIEPHPPSYSPSASASADGQKVSAQSNKTDGQVGAVYNGPSDHVSKKNIDEKPKQKKKKKKDAGSCQNTSNQSSSSPDRAPVSAKRNYRSRAPPSHRDRYSEEGNSRSRNPGYCEEGNSRSRNLRNPEEDNSRSRDLRNPREADSRSRSHFSNFSSDR